MLSAGGKAPNFIFVFVSVAKTLNRSPMTDLLTVMTNKAVMATWDIRSETGHMAIFVYSGQKANFSFSSCKLDELFQWELLL